MRVPVGEVDDATEGRVRAGTPVGGGKVTTD